MPSFENAAEPEIPTATGSDDVVLYSFIRRRSLGQFHAYGLTTVKRLPSGELVELKQVIPARMYAILSNSADPTREVVRQKRYCFQWERQSFHIYEYLSPKAGIWVVQCQSESDPAIPSFLKVGPELSKEDGKILSSRQISLRRGRYEKVTRAYFRDKVCLPGRFCDVVLIMYIHLYKKITFITYITITP